MNESEPMGGALNQPEAYQNRNAAMNEGINGGPVATSAGLQQAQARDNSGGPARVRLTGSLNGLSQSQSTDTANGMLKTANGQAADSYANTKWLQDRQQ